MPRGEAQRLGDSTTWRPPLAGLAGEGLRRATGAAAWAAGHSQTALTC